MKTAVLALTETLAWSPIVCHYRLSLLFYYVIFYLGALWLLFIIISLLVILSTILFLIFSQACYDPTRFKNCYCFFQGISIRTCFFIF